MAESLQNIGLSQIRKIIPHQDIVRMGDDFFILEAKYDKSMQFLRYPCRSDAYISIFCRRGKLDVEINLIPYSVNENTLFFSTPGNIVKVNDIRSEDESELDFVVAAISKEFLSSINFDFKKIFDEHISFLSNPCVKLQDEGLSFCFKYFELLKEVVDADLPGKEDSVRSLIGSLFYVLLGLMEKDISQMRMSQVQPARPQDRVKILFERFMSLVAEYHTSQRGMSFYANRLNLTPKYLSKLIKQASGRSAPDWIDSFVILEAKNMLKYTDDSIKEIVYKLHFPNPSVFYKFFKVHTGMTPSEYRKGE